ncbi:MAG TPA: DUF4388 domain-containing protein [Pyrinomonadaceae bacterium]|nr:DUF4388 domain-containing protein [Pyrinomonadaceae bacterium]
MGIHGTLTTMSVSDLLQFLATGRKTGTLKFGRGKVVKEIYFENGIIVGANTNDPKEYLGQVLIHYGKATESQLQVAMEVQRKSGGRLGEILVAQGFLTAEGVLEILRIRTLDIIYDLFIWENAQFEFYDNERLPEDLIRIEVEPTNVIMEGIYRMDELARYRTLIPSDRAVLEPGEGKRPLSQLSNEVRQLFDFVARRMSVAEICYNMHASAFEVYAQLFELVSNGTARVAGELPKGFDVPEELQDLPESASELLWLARRELKDGNAERALPIVHRVLFREPKNSEAQELLSQAEQELIKKIYVQLSPHAVPQVAMEADKMVEQQLGPQEAFVLSRINGKWDIESILSICPFREADSLRMIKNLLDGGIIIISNAPE